MQGVLERAFLELHADAPTQHRKAGASPGSPPLLFSPLPSPLLFSSSFPLFPLPSSLLIQTRVLIFLVLVWVVVLALWGRGLLVGILWSWGALCSGGVGGFVWV